MTFFVLWYCLNRSRCDCFPILFDVLSFFSIFHCCNVLALSPASNPTSYKGKKPLTLKKSGIFSNIQAHLPYER
ncbi:hypothetical protein Y032_0123g1127 [Ancylostoma ceylanicum]|uniref:Uncharacterized protein n=1 Tax=Ancylostoma ceylanicum TaxID=53326 RepID=A0A016T9C9_9BILA|nr:hypothetical protein Y032_0123g1127 [Ancylostoma ceylanicum]